MSKKMKERADAAYAIAQERGAKKKERKHPSKTRFGAIIEGEEHQDDKHDMPCTSRDTLAELRRLAVITGHSEGHNGKS